MKLYTGAVATACSAVLLLTTACAPEQAADPRPAIEAAAVTWQQSYNNGDAAGIAALYADDARLLPPGSPAISGREAIEAYWASAISATDFKFEIESGDVFAGGQFATEEGRYTAVDADGNTVDQGKYVVLWREEQGEWLMIRDIWNSDQAPAVESAAVPASGNPLIDDALAAAMPSLTATATVMDWEGNVLREGSGEYTCLPTAPQSPPGTAPMCMDAPSMAWAEAWSKRTDLSIDRLGIAYMLAGDAGASNTDPFATEPTDDNDWVVEGAHLMLFVPDPALLEGIPTDPQNGGPYVMWKGTPYAHVMVPVAD